MTVENGSHSGSTGTDETNNQNGQGNEGDSQKPEPQFVTVEEFDRKLNSAITGHLKRTEQRFNQSLDEKFTSLKDLLEKAPASQTAQSNQSKESQSIPEKNTQTGDKTQQSAQSQSSNVVPPEVKSLQDQVSDLTKRLADSEKKAAKEASEKREASIRAKVVETATQLGSDKGNQIYRLLKEQFDLDDAGSVKFKSDANGYEDLKDLKGGLHDWLNSDEGKHFLPAKNFQGSGASNNQAGGSTAAGRTYTIQELDALPPKELAKLDVPKLIAQGKVITK
jgi:hypothetical protein